MEQHTGTKGSQLTFRRDLSERVDQVAAHLGGVLVGAEAGKQVDNAIGQSHDGCDSGSFERLFVEGPVRRRS